NEADVGAGLRKSGVPRSEVFITTKLWNSDQGFDSALRAFDGSLRELGTDYVDLYLIHWPVPGKRAESWRALERILSEKRARAIGVSNFMVRHLQEVLDHSPVVPAVNQVEFNPFLYQRALLEFCQGKGIQLESYSPLTKGYRLSHPALNEVARRYGKSPAQVLIRWCLQRDTVVIPKSAHPRRIEENAAVFDFEISPADLATLDGLNEDLHTGWDPTHAP
ncbi:MAG TPA: aldo/keto reductase, partial [Myxococcaceae bacterium]|nr:aldo/keto reductase [Myxococcaceae bacterium]